MSPRLSFSNDFSQAETIPTPLQFQSCSSNFRDFDFCFHSRETNLEWSSADELFVDGKMLPVEIKKKIDTSQEIIADKDSRHEISKGNKIPSKRNEAISRHFANQEIKKKIAPPFPPLRAFLEATGAEEGYVNEDWISHDNFTETKISCKKKNNSSSSSRWSFGGTNVSMLCPCPLLCRSKTAGKRIELSREIQNHRRNSVQSKPLALAHLQISSLTGYRHQRPL